MIFVFQTILQFFRRQSFSEFVFYKQHLNVFSQRFLTFFSKLLHTPQTNLMVFFFSSENNKTTTSTDKPFCRSKWRLFWLFCLFYILYPSILRQANCVTFFFRDKSNTNLFHETRGNISWFFIHLKYPQSFFSKQQLRVYF